MTKTRDEKTEICKTLSLVCHIENFKVRHADDFKNRQGSAKLRETARNKKSF